MHDTLSELPEPKGHSSHYVVNIKGVTVPAPEHGTTYVDQQSDSFDLQIRYAVDENYELSLLYDGIPNMASPLSYIHAFNDVSEVKVSGLIAAVSAFLENPSDDQLSVLSDYVEVIDERPKSQLKP